MPFSSDLKIKSLFGSLINIDGFFLFSVDIIVPSLNITIFELKFSSILTINLLGAFSKYSLFLIRYLFDVSFIIFIFSSLFKMKFKYEFSYGSIYKAKGESN